ncbi:hypothetical protein ES702_04530 [subsurface metagenome]
MKFELGNKVKHKAGGPKMIICSVTPEGLCSCRWYSRANDKFNSQNFQAEELELIGKK